MNQSGKRRGNSSELWQQVSKERSGHKQHAEFQKLQQIKQHYEEPASYKVFCCVDTTLVIKSYQLSSLPFSTGDSIHQFNTYPAVPLHISANGILQLL